MTVADKLNDKGYKVTENKQIIDNTFKVVVKVNKTSLKAVEDFEEVFGRIHDITYFNGEYSVIGLVEK